MTKFWWRGKRNKLRLRRRAPEGPLVKVTLSLEIQYTKGSRTKPPEVFAFFFFFPGLHLRHMEVPRLGVKSELQLPAYATATATLGLSCIYDLHHSSQQPRILNPLSKARDQTSSWLLVGFVTAESQWELQTTWVWTPPLPLINWVTWMSSLISRCPSYLIGKVRGMIIPYRAAVNYI